MNRSQIVKHSVKTCSKLLPAFHSLIYKQFKQRYSTVLCRYPRNKLLKTYFYTVNGERGIAFIFRALRGVLRIRYIILGSAVGGGVQLSKVKNLFFRFCIGLLYSYYRLSYYFVHLSLGLKIQYL